MRLAASNIGWPAEQDDAMYALLQQLGFSGLEIAPTRLFPDAPYTRTAEAKAFSKNLFEQYGLCIPSMQSIWYGKTESIFGSDADRIVLIEYTKRAMDWANAIGCGNLVFGCPKNRNVPAGSDASVAEDFFGTVARYAVTMNVTLALEPNPPIYQTNFLNTVDEACAYVHRLATPGLAVNLDVGAMIYDGTLCKTVQAELPLLHHVHISEPYLKPVVRRDLHAELLAMLQQGGYEGFVSLEMGLCEQACMQASLTYVADLACAEKVDSFAVR